MRTENDGYCTDWRSNWMKRQGPVQSGVEPLKE